MEIVFKSLAAFLLFAPLVYAALSDFREMIIPNWVSLTIAAGFCVFAIAVWPNIDLTRHLVIATVLFGASFLFWFVGWLGGGDVKLLGAVGLWLGTQFAIVFLLLLAVVSTSMAGFLIVLRWRLQKNGVSSESSVLTGRVKEMARSGRIAYGIPIVIAAIATLPRLFI